MPIPDIAPVSTPSGTGITRLVYWMDLADTLGYRLSTTVASEATGNDPNRVILADELRDDERGYRSGLLWAATRETTTAATTQRRILGQEGVGYQGSQSAIVLSRPFAASLDAATVIDITAPLPVLGMMGRSGLVECVNKALARIKVRARLTLTGSGTTSTSLVSYPFVTDTVEIFGVFDTRGLPTSYAAEPAPYAARIDTDGITHTLVTEGAYGTGETFYLDVIVDADRLIYDGASWAYVADNSERGLQGDTYQAATPLSWVRAFGMKEALALVADQIEDDEKLSDAQKERLLARNARERQRWVRASNVIRWTRFPRPHADARRGMGTVAYEGGMPLIRPWV